MEKAVVPTLEDLAFEVSFKEILGNLMLCHGYLPEGKELPLLPFSSFLATVPLPSSEGMMSLVRARLDRILVGTMSDKIREKYVKLFYDNLLDPGNHQNMIDIWVFLSVVLDSNFLKLETHVAFPGSKPNLNLISIIAENSPLLERLQLNFKLMKKDSTDLMKPLMLPLSSLENLTDLCLSSLHHQIRTTVLSLICASCPKLTHLTVSGFRFEKKDVLAIMFGEKIGDLLPNELEEPEWFRDEELERLELSSEYLTPLCLTLQALTFLWNDGGDTNSICPSTAVWVFLLRHLPSIKTLDVWKPRLRLEITLSWVVKRLYLVEEMKMKTKFEKAFQRAAERLGSAPAEQLTLGRSLTSSFSGCCASITKINNVNVLDTIMLKAIGSFCPSLKDISFYETKNSNQPSTDHEFDASIEEIESILKGWKMKIDILGCKSVSSGCVELILKVFGPGMLTFRLWNSNSFDLESLMPCRQLLSLFLIGCTFDSTKPSAIDVASFLPNLKEFRCFSCLGPWSSLFENKPLQSLTLNCCHLLGDGNGTDGPPPKRFKPEAKCLSKWSQIPQLWGEQMTHLEILKCAGLTMATLFNLIPQFKKLKKVSLPDVVKTNESSEILSNCIMENLSRNMPLVKFTFTKPSSKWSKCFFLDPK